MTKDAEYLQHSTQETLFIKTKIIEITQLAALKFKNQLKNRHTLYTKSRRLKGGQHRDNEDKKTRLECNELIIIKVY